MSHYTEEQFMDACKAGNMAVVQVAINKGMDVNVSSGWALRRAVRYNKPLVWQQLLIHPNIDVNLTNQYGLSALHTACRFNVLSALTDLMTHPDIKVNEKTMLGSSPLMVAVKYTNCQAVQFLINDARVDVSTLDNMGRTIDQVIGVARTGSSKDILKIVEMIKIYKKKEEVSLATIEEQVIEEAVEEVDSFLQKNILEGINELTKKVGDENTTVNISNQWLRKMPVTQMFCEHEKQMDEFELRQKLELENFESERKERLAIFQEEQQMAMNNYLGNQEKEMQTFCECQDLEIAVFNQRLIMNLKNLREKQRQENIEVRNELESKTCSNNIKNHIQNAIDHLQSKLTYIQQNEEEALQDNALLDSARKDLECPVCLEVMAPPVRIWQCETGHVICETCKERVQGLMGAVYAKYCQHCQDFHSDKRSTEHKGSITSSPLGWGANADDILSGLNSGVGSSIRSNSIISNFGHDSFSCFNSRKSSLIGFHSRRNSFSSDVSSASGHVSPNNHGLDSPTNPQVERPNISNNRGAETPNSSRHHGLASSKIHELESLTSPRNHDSVSPTNLSNHRRVSHTVPSNHKLVSPSSKEKLPESRQDGTAICPTCKTAPFTGRNFALERISRTLFCVK